MKKIRDKEESLKSFRCRVEPNEFEETKRNDNLKEYKKQTKTNPLQFTLNMHGKDLLL